MTFDQNGAQRDGGLLRTMRSASGTRPWAITASTPWRSSQTASSQVVAEAMTRAPMARTAANSAASGRPKWKLATLGLNSISRSQNEASKAAREAPLASGGRPSSP